MKNADKPVTPLMGADRSFLTGKNSADESFIKQCDPLIGLTKREHVAAMAMQGLLSDAVTVGSFIEARCGTGLTPESLAAEVAVIHADALLAALEADSE